jgi:hypothetical protein
MMKLQHTAALALVGWYLISPPWKPYANGRNRPDPQAPISEWYFQQMDRKSWEISRTGARLFTAQAACEAKIESDKQEFRTWKRVLDTHSQRVPDSIWENLSSGSWQTQVSSELCVASDDPRLNSN